MTYTLTPEDKDIIIKGVKDYAPDSIRDFFGGKRIGDIVVENFDFNIFSARSPTDLSVG